MLLFIYASDILQAQLTFKDAAESPTNIFRAHIFIGMIAKFAWQNEKDNGYFPKSFP